MMEDGTEFWIICKRLKLLRKAGCLQLTFEFTACKPWESQLGKQWIYKAFVNWFAKFGIQFQNFKVRIVIWQILLGMSKLSEIKPPLPMKKNQMKTMKLLSITSWLIKWYQMVVLAITFDPTSSEPLLNY